MGRLTNEPFSPSCCDGGACGPNDRSAQPCGCDPGCGPEGYLCERHRVEETGGGGEKSHVVDAMPVSTDGTNVTTIIKDAKWRKERPLWSGCLRYFPDALLEVAHVSYIGNEQHNPGQPLHWDRSKSQDEQDACARHLVEAGTRDSDGCRHSAKAAWRALANLQKELEKEENG